MDCEIYVNGTGLKCMLKWYVKDYYYARFHSRNNCKHWVKDNYLSSQEPIGKNYIPHSMSAGGYNKDAVMMYYLTSEFWLPF